MDALSLTTLLSAALVAGWVDAVVGGGGLLLLPALLVAAPGVPVATALGTNKLAAIFGTSTAAVTYARRTKLDWGVAGPAAGLAVLTAGLGAALAGAVPGSAYRPVVLVVLVAVAVFVLARPSLGVVSSSRRTPRRVVVAVAVAGLGIALYDGLIGPGTGTFLVLAFTAILGSDFVHASAMAKVVNAGTNLGALVVFGLTGHVWWALGAAMAVCNVVGAAVGARMALRRGAGFVRVVLLVVVLALVVRLGYDQWVAG
ncbi:TSUP family transporter [Micromonospora sp. C32]|uniref:sulfite exporter TauE/SafE family protein n=1 Tax=unclassified Micromonospora TaxID=2617518 RepID=UPI001B37DC87|nr:MULTISPECIES: TSUP family transporter [unclassified Micromonospora]MBQ1046464.1 TSUP family transporter [Micromonospora sp. C72]MBQ1058660.1 TSUP family transporter [Micromonospora sp. C32]